MTTPADAASLPLDAVVVGETMVVFTCLGGDPTWVASPAGAESNVAAGLAAVGHRARWVSRLGDDHLGRLVVESVAAGGVEVDVEWDADHPTGLMTKYVVGGSTERRYYRSTSAARLLSVADLPRLDVAPLVHVTGITPAISSSAAELISAVVERPRGGVRVSFDVNLRPTLWPDLDVATETLLPIARWSDTIFIGDDEAVALLGTDDVDEVAAALLQRSDQELVLKRGAGPATVVVAGRTTTEPAATVDVVDPTGAGDAFAAGFLSGRIRGWEDAGCLRLGHALAARVMGVTDDMVSPMGPDELRALLDATG